MKNIIPLFLLFLLACHGTNAQSPIEVTETTLDFGNSSMPGFSVTIPEADYESTMKNWVKLLESGTKSKVVTEKDGMTIFGAKIKSVSDNPVNVYSKLSKQDSILNLKVAIELEKDRYAGNTEMTGTREYLVDFAKDQYLDIVNKQLAEQEKILRDLKKDLNSLERNQSKMEKSIRSNNQDIKADEKRLADLNNELASVSSELSKFQVGGMGSTATSADRDHQKDLEKQENKIKKEINSLEKKLGKNEVEVSQNQREIPRNVNSQEDANTRVQEQQAIVDKLTAKRDAIKNYK